mgnify:FL=1
MNRVEVDNTKQDEWTLVKNVDKGIYLDDISKEVESKESNQTELEKYEVRELEDKLLLLRTHMRMSHLSFNKIRSLSIAGHLPKRLAKASTPVCPACVCGKQTKKTHTQE